MSYQGYYNTPQGQGGYGSYPPQPQYPPQQKQQQPQQTAMYSSTTQMNPQVVIVKENVPEGPKEWNFGLFDCFTDLGLCFKSCCCPCVTYGENKEKINNSDSCVGNTLLFCCVQYCCGLGCILGAIHRNEVRSKYNIEGSSIGDFVTHLCCNCCALIQEAREIEASSARS